MSKPLTPAKITGAAVLVSFCAVSFAQNTVGWKLHCLNVGNSGQVEPLGDREGHALSVSEYTCRTEGGPLDGAVYTGNGVWEWDKATAQRRAGSGIYRKSGAMLVYGQTTGDLTLTMTEGKVTGWISNIRGTYNLATGSAASMAGKSWTAVAHPTGARQFVVDVKVE